MSLTSLTKQKTTSVARLDDSLSRGMELVFTPALLGVVGFLADRFLGIVPVLTIALAVFGVVGMGVRSFYRYDSQMRIHEASGPWAPGGAAVQDTDADDPQPARFGPRAPAVEPEPSIADAYIEAMRPGARAAGHSTARLGAQA
ncbi:MAG: hypothetical protein NVS3B12_17810 [Acidimicrobiales bacterium]